MLGDSQNCRLNPAASLSWVSWDDEYVVFDETSGQTHQMNALRAYVLNSLDKQGLSFKTLVTDVMSSLGSSTDTDLTAVVDSILREFETHGLVEFSQT
jgi:PqqD family protein of HPr-rel-A system